MKIFKGMNTNGKCLICETNEDKPCTLVGIIGTIGTEDNKNLQASQVHIECLELFYYPDRKIIAQQL